MASNRYRQIISVKSNYLPQEFIPNFEQYAQALGNQQKLYDEAQSLRDLVPKHLTVDRPDVEAYRQGVSGKIDELSNLYNTQGVQAGNRYRSNLLRDVRRDWQPGGKAYGFQQNYDAYQNYIKQLDEYHKAGKISADKRNALAQKSMQVFGKSYNDDVFKDFSGITAAEDVDLAKQADELAKGWAEDKVRQGIYTIKNGQYFDVQTNTVIDPQEIYNQIAPQLLADPKNVAYFNQAALLSGNNRDEIAFNLVDNAAQFAATKYGKFQQDSQFLSNWMLREQIKLSNKKKLLDYENTLNAGTEETIAYTVNSGMLPLDLDGAKIKTGTIEANLPPGTPRQNFVRESVDTYKNIPLEDYANSDDGKRLYPGLNQMLQEPQFQRLYGKESDPNWVESNEEYNKRIQQAWDSKRKALSTAIGKFSEFNDQQAERASDQVFGKEGRPGSLLHKSIWVKRPGREPELIDARELLRITGHKNIEELNKSSRIIGDISTDNGIHPSGYEAIVNKKNGKDQMSIIIGRTSMQDANFNKPVFELMSPLHDGSMNESSVVPWQPAKNLPTQFLRTRATDRWNGSNFAGRTLDIYEIQTEEGYTMLGTDPNGVPILHNGQDIIYDTEGKYTKEVKSSVTPEDLTTANDIYNPYMPTKMNKRLSNE